MENVSNNNVNETQPEVHTVETLIDHRAHQAEKAAIAVSKKTSKFFAWLNRGVENTTVYTVSVALHAKDDISEALEKRKAAKAKAELEAELKLLAELKAKHPKA